jgi:shikimate kinase
MANKITLDTYSSKKVEEFEILGECELDFYNNEIVVCVSTSGGIIMLPATNRNIKSLNLGVAYQAKREELLKRTKVEEAPVQEDPDTISPATTTHRI